MDSELAGLLGVHLRRLGHRPPEHLPLRPVQRGRPGDFSTAVAHTVAAPGQEAERLAGALADQLRAEPRLAHVHAAAGHLTLTLSTAALVDGVRRLLQGTGAATARQPALDGGWPADLFPVAFAYARCRNVARAARAHGVRPTPGEELEDALGAVVDQEHSRDLLVRLSAEVPRGRAAAVLLHDLAATYQDFYARTRTAPRGPEPVTSTHRTHLALTEATAVALATGLSTLGLHAPEHL